jgi:chemotaxis protein CheD
MGEAIMVGMAEIKVTQSADSVLIALGLGSCIGVCVYDPVAHVAGMAHIVLPDSAGHEPNPLKFADTAIPLLVQEMERNGAVAARLRAALAGGAQLFAFSGSGPRLEIGPRNKTAVLAALEQYRICVAASDLGGTAGRTVHLTGEGRVSIKTLGKGEQELILLGAASEAAAPFRTMGGAGNATVQTAGFSAPGLETIRQNQG